MQTNFFIFMTMWSGMGNKAYYNEFWEKSCGYALFFTNIMTPLYFFSGSPLRVGDVQPE